MNTFTESVVEDAALAWLAGLGFTVKNGPEIAPGEPAAERGDYGQVVLEARLRDALARLNPALPPEALDDAFRKLTRPEGPTLEARNRALHRLLVDGIVVEYRQPSPQSPSGRGSSDAGENRIVGRVASVIDFENPDNNDWLAVNQFTVTENKHNRRPDIVLFVNGLPLVLVELKNAADENATIWSAFQQLQTYRAELPTLFAYNALLVASDGLEARIGTLTAGREWFKPWRTVHGEALAPATMPELQVMIEGVFDRRRLLDLIGHFLVFEDDGSGKLAKKMAGYHQFHAVNVALGETLRAARTHGKDRVAEGGDGYLMGARPGGEPGDRRIGVVWHTQGSGKSLSMAFYAGRVIREPAMANPTVVVLTDRNDLDDQLFGTFSRCQDLLRQPPAQAENRANLRVKLSVEAGGVVFTTIQKFLPEEKGDRHPVLSNRRNIIVIADEAHRSQYDFIDGFARHMRDALPNASFIGFTGTPIELVDANTRAVFGDYISVYDIQRAVEDKATVPIYYESRLAKLELSAAERPKVDPEFEEVTEGEEIERKEKLKSKWAQLEAVVGAEKRLKLLARDIVEHFERRLEALDGKAMVVCMSRRICVELFKEIVALRPGWAQGDDDQGIVKVVMTGSATDPLDWQQHIRNKPRREVLANRFRDPRDPFKIVLVRDMWLTGFDAPSLHTMYMDKPMRGHGLMQAIARVNRVFRDKPGGLVVDYLGLAQELKKALATYTESGGTGKTAIDQEEAVAVMLEKHEVCCGLFHRFDWSKWTTGAPPERLGLLPLAQEHILAQTDGKNRLMAAVQGLSQAFALAVPHAEAMRILDDVAFFQAVRASLAKRAPGEARTEEELDLAVRQIVSRAVSSDGVVDIFEAAGLKKPDISILSEEFLAEVRGMPQRNLAVELLRKLLAGEIRTRRRKNVVQSRSFLEMLENTLRKYQNRAIEAAQVIEELIGLARDMREASARGEALGLTEDEVAFYDALETNDSVADCPASSLSLRPISPHNFSSSGAAVSPEISSGGSPSSPSPMVPKSGIFARRGRVRIDDPLRVAADISLIVGNRRLLDGFRAECRALRRPTVVTLLAPILEDHVRSGRFGRLVTRLRGVVEKRQSVGAHDPVAAIADEPAMVKAYRVLQPSGQFHLQCVRTSILDRELHDRDRQAGVIGIKRYERGIGLEQDLDWQRWITVFHDADWILAAEAHVRKTCLVQRVATVANLQDKTLFDGRCGLHRTGVVVGAGAHWLIEDVPVPEPAVAAEVELSRANAADRHANVLQRLASVDHRRAAIKQRLDPRRAQLLVGGHEPLEIAVYERPGHRREARCQQGQCAASGGFDKGSPVNGATTRCRAFSNGFEGTIFSHSDIPFSFESRAFVFDAVIPAQAEPRATRQSYPSGVLCRTRLPRSAPNDGINCVNYDSI
jgi:type I restriction enzyme R subunit